MGDKFLFKLIIYVNKYKLMRLLLNVYIEEILIILLGEVKTDYYTNWDIIVLFDKFC